MSRDSRIGLPLSIELQHGEKAFAFLHVTREGVEMARPLVAGERAPWPERLARRLHRRVDVSRRASRRAGDALARRGIEDFEQRARLAEAP